jgi:hypothetical protein
MGTLTGAPKDPAFWFHHTTVDLLLNQFLQNNGRVSNDSIVPSESCQRSRGVGWEV